MKLASPFAELFATPETPDLGPGPRAGLSALQPLQAAIDVAFAGRSLEPQRAQTARALVLLWHDHHDPAHAIVQDEEAPDASYVHAILHRREPDYGNAKYWFRLVRQHPCYERLAEEAAALLKLSGEEALRAKLLPGGRWDAFVFVDACEKAIGRGGDGKAAAMLRRLQEAEFAVLMDYLTRG